MLIQVLLSIIILILLVALVFLAIKMSALNRRLESSPAEIESLKRQLESSTSMAQAQEENLSRRLADKDESCRRLVEATREACEKSKQELIENYKASLAEKESTCQRLLNDKDANYRAALEEKDRVCAAKVEAGRKACDEIIAEKDAALQQKERDCRALVAEKNAEFEKLFQEQGKSFDAMVKGLQEQFSSLAEQKLKLSTIGLTDFNQKRMDEILKPFREELDRFRQSFDANRAQQVANKASFDQAISDLGKRALQIGADAENLAKALKCESKTQGDWGEMVLSNILVAAGLKEGIDFFPQAQELDEAGNRLIPDVEIPLPNHEKLLIDSKASVTAYFDYVASVDEAGRAQAIKNHILSVRKHMDELADKDYIKKIRGSQGYILMFIPNEGSYLLAMEHDRKLATDAFHRHVIIVNPTTLLLCLQIVALLRSRESQNENAEKISLAAGRLYDKFVSFAESFVEIGASVDKLSKVYTKANKQLCEGKGNVIRQLENLKTMGVVTTKGIDSKLLEESSSNLELEAQSH